jgi:hypothetical protein
LRCSQICAAVNSSAKTIKTGAFHSSSHANSTGAKIKNSTTAAADSKSAAGGVQYRFTFLPSSAAVSAAQRMQRQGNALPAASQTLPPRRQQPCAGSSLAGVW